MGDEANACVHNDRNDIQIKYSRWFLLSNTPTRCLLRSVPKVGASALNVQRDPRNEINHTHTHTHIHLFGQRSSRYFRHFSLLFYRRMCNNRDESKKRKTRCRRIGITSFESNPPSTWLEILLETISPKFQTFSLHDTVERSRIGDRYRR